MKLESSIDYFEDLPKKKLNEFSEFVPNESFTQEDVSLALQALIDAGLGMDSNIKSLEEPVKLFLKGYRSHNFHTAFLPSLWQFSPSDADMFMGVMSSFTESRKKNEALKKK